ncbi:MAG: hypothetical protein OIF50_08910 [Flavobacteriaceae bacterium]|nr:hypothetical protein [Flavobacteriaceae bacterium]
MKPHQLKFYYKSEALTVAQQLNFFGLKDPEDFFIYIYCSDAGNYGMEFLPSGLEIDSDYTFFLEKMWYVGLRIDETALGLFPIPPSTKKLIVEARLDKKKMHAKIYALPKDEEFINGKDTSAFPIYYEGTFTRHSVNEEVNEGIDAGQEPVPYKCFYCAYGRQDLEKKVLCGRTGTYAKEKNCKPKLLKEEIEILPTIKRRPYYNSKSMNIDRMIAAGLCFCVAIYMGHIIAILVLFFLFFATIIVYFIEKDEIYDK